MRVRARVQRQGLRQGQGQAIEGNEAVVSGRAVTVAIQDHNSVAIGQQWCETW